MRGIPGNIADRGGGDVSTLPRIAVLTFAESLGAFDYDVAFADPPYASGGAERLAGRWIEVPFSRVLSVEHAARDAMPARGVTRKYGTTAITFYRSEE